MTDETTTTPVPRLGLRVEVFGSDGATAIQNNGQDVAHIVFVDRQTAADDAAEGHWRELTDQERQSILDQIIRGLGCVERAPFPPSGVCTCGAEEWMIVEDGYMRWTCASIERVEGEPPTMIGYTDGWDDMSEDGTDQWMACQTCSATFGLPDFPIDYT